MSGNNVDVTVADRDEGLVEIRLILDLAGRAQQAAVGCPLKSSLDRVRSHVLAPLSNRRPQSFAVHVRCGLNGVSLPLCAIIWRGSVPKVTWYASFTYDTDEDEASKKPSHPGGF